MVDYHEPSVSCSAISSIESLVTEFLEMVLQSSQPAKAESREREDGPKNKIKLNMANRSKRASTRCMIYPRKAAGGSARPFAQLFRMLDLSHEALVVNEPITKRELFYRDVTLFRSQRVVDQLVDDVAASFHLERREMNIRASSKGLVCGEGLTISLRQGDEIHATADGGTLIPVIEDIKFYSVSGDICWVLIVEKEAVFNTLCQLCLVNHPTLPGQGVLITGKGYPDMATRYLVNYLAKALPVSVPILALVDGDPYGLDILSVYTYGSQSLRHENEKLSAERTIGIGLWVSDIQELGIDLDSMLPLTEMDERKAFAMLRTRTLPSKWKNELMRMIHTKRKAEIEIMLTMPRTSESASGLFGYSPFFTFLVQQCAVTWRRDALTRLDESEFENRLIIIDASGKSSFLRLNQSRCIRMSGDVQTSRVTRSSVLGKRAHQQQDATTATLTKSCNVQLPTPDSTPNPKRPRTSISSYDGDSNKENVPPSSSQTVGSDVAPTVAGTVRATTTEQLTPTRSRPLRRHASTTSAMPTNHGFSNSSLTTPPATPKPLLPLYARVKALLRTTCNANATITCRDAECDVIMKFLQSFLSGEATQRCLYISGSPGTGKTALLNSVLRTSKHDLCNVMTINCMTLKGVDALWQQLFDDLVSTNAELKKAARLKKLKGREAVEMALAALSKRCILVLDELDHIASDPRALDDILALPKNNPKSFCLIGIANTHTLMSGISSGIHSTTNDVVTIHFAPYTATQLQEILQSRLSLLNDSNDGAMKTFLPLSVLTLLTKKVAAMTGDVRTLFEVLRGAIDIAMSSSNGDENSLSRTVKVTPPCILQALKLYASTASTPKACSTNGSVACNSEIIAKINGLNLQARVILLCILLASKRLGANLPLSSASTSPRKAPLLKRSSSANCSRQTSIDTTLLHNYYSAALLRCDAACLNVASKSEFGDLLVILEGAGLISSGSPVVSSTSSTRQGKKTLSRSVSFSGFRKSLATSEIRLTEGVWMVEVLRGLGIADDNDDNVLQSEIRSIWERETARMERETKNLGQCENPSLY
ncbi:hypothetical protein APHAL10511_000163 [Amanita phalloides]|nr:hypothetical protein APHAL10511_000163 [Amanita phalloides]